MSRILLLITSCWAIGCVAGEAPADLTDQVDQAVISPNGTSANGISPTLFRSDGNTLNGIHPDGVGPDGSPIHIAIAGAPWNGAGLVGSTWTGLVSDGAAITLRIDDARPGAGTNLDVWAYQLSVSSAGTWQPLCVDAAGNPGFADTVRGSWNLAQGVLGGGAYHPDTTDFTLACRGSAIAKCVELGYKPWTGHARELAACVRALRGDYCGDGTPYTVTGTRVNLYDDAGLQPDGVAWDLEAAWTPDGAACVTAKDQTRFWQVAHVTPSCFPQALKPRKSCGAEFTGDVAIMTELPPL